MSASLVSFVPKMFGHVNCYQIVFVLFCRLFTLTLFLGQSKSSMVYPKSTQLFKDNSCNMYPFCSSDHVFAYMAVLKATKTRLWAEQLNDVSL